jgi:hypothetical protein
MSLLTLPNYVSNALGNGTMPVRTFGQLYSFKNFAAPANFSIVQLGGAT